MLRWRLLLGILIIAALAGLCRLDHTAWLPGTWLMPLAAIFVILATEETSQLMAAGSAQPRGWIVYCGNLLILLSNWMPIILVKWNLWTLPGENECLSRQQAMALAAWPLAALTICVLIVFINEMKNFQKPGGAVANLSASIFALVYVGLLVSFLVQLRLAWGVGALVSLIIAVKMGDIGAFLAGSIFGRHKMTPVLSPGKTVEGAIGAICFACLGAWLSFRFLLPSTLLDCILGASWIWLPFGILVGIAGILGDLAESLIKRDAGRKDSSTWMPGFGGVLDILDSLLFAAPVAWLFWIFILTK
jgi:phosphatidate cytidylyltransferase